MYLISGIFHNDEEPLKRKRKGIAPFFFSSARLTDAGHGRVIGSPEKELIPGGGGYGLNFRHNSLEGQESSTSESSVNWAP